MKKDVKLGDYEKPKGFDTSQYFEASINIKHSEPTSEEE